MKKKRMTQSPHVSQRLDGDKPKVFLRPKALTLQVLFKPRVPPKAASEVVYLSHSVVVIILKPADSCGVLVLFPGNKAGEKTEQNS